MILLWKIFNDLSAIKPSDLFELYTSSATRGHAYKIVTPRCNLDVRSRFFSVRVVKNWNSLKSDTVTASSLGQFKRLLHRDLGPLLSAYC